MPKILINMKQKHFTVCCVELSIPLKLSVSWELPSTMSAVIGTAGNVDWSRMSIWASTSPGINHKVFESRLWNPTESRLWNVSVTLNAQCEILTSQNVFVWNIENISETFKTNFRFDMLNIFMLSMCECVCERKREGGGVGVFHCCIILDMSNDWCCRCTVINVVYVLNWLIVGAEYKQILSFIGLLL